MRSDELQEFKESIIYIALCQWRLKRSLPERTGPLCLDLGEFRRRVGRTRMVASFVDGAQKTLNDMLGSATSRIYYDSALAQFTLYFNDNISVEYPFLFLGDAGYKIPEAMLEEFQISSTTTGAAGQITPPAPLVLPERPQLTVTREDYHGRLPPKPR